MPTHNANIPTSPERIPPSPTFASSAASSPPDRSKGKGRPPHQPASTRVPLDPIHAPVHPHSPARPAKQHHGARDEHEHKAALNPNHVNRMRPPPVTADEADSEMADEAMTVADDDEQWRRQIDSNNKRILRGDKRVVEEKQSGNVRQAGAVDEIDTKEIDTIFGAIKSTGDSDSSSSGTTPASSPARGRRPTRSSAQAVVSPARPTSVLSQSVSELVVSPSKAKWRARQQQQQHLLPNDDMADDDLDEDEDDGDADWNPNQSKRGKKGTKSKAKDSSRRQNATPVRHQRKRSAANMDADAEEEHEQSGSDYEPDGDMKRCGRSSATRNKRSKQHHGDERSVEDPNEMMNQSEQSQRSRRNKPSAADRTRGVANAVHSAEELSQLTGHAMSVAAVESPPQPHPQSSPRRTRTAAQTRARTRAPAINLADEEEGEQDESMGSSAPVTTIDHASAVDVAVQSALRGGTTGMSASCALSAPLSAFSFAPSSSVSAADSALARDQQRSRAAFDALTASSASASPATAAAAPYATYGYATSSSADTLLHAYQLKRREQEVAEQRSKSAAQAAARTAGQQSTNNQSRTTPATGMDVQLTWLKMAHFYHLDEHACNGPVTRRLCLFRPHCLHGLGQKKEGIWAKVPPQLRALGPDPSSRCRDAHTRHAGLKNLGATCYMNTLFQTLFMNSHFRTKLYRFQMLMQQRKLQQQQATAAAADKVKEEKDTPMLPSEENVLSRSSSSSSEAVAASNRERIVTELANLFARLEFGRSSFEDPSRIVHCLGLNRAHQQDVNEFNTLLLHVIDSRLKEAKADGLSTLVDDEFKGTIRHAIRCHGCQYCSSNDTPFYDLTLQIANNKSVEQALVQALQKEILSGGNQYKCSQCRSLQDADRYSILTQLPPVLNLQLIRFAYDPVTDSKKKLMNNIRIPAQIDMAPFTSENHIQAMAEDMVRQEYAPKNGKSNKSEVAAMTTASTSPPSTVVHAASAVTQSTSPASIVPELPPISAMITAPTQPGFDSEPPRLPLADESSSTDAPSTPSSPPKRLPNPPPPVPSTPPTLPHIAQHLSSPPATAASSSSVTSPSPLPLAPLAPQIYELTAILRHKGVSAHHGHYIADIRDPYDPNKWWRFDDDSCKPLTQFDDASNEGVVDLSSSGAKKGGKKGKKGAGGAAKAKKKKAKIGEGDGESDEDFEVDAKGKEKTRARGQKAVVNVEADEDDGEDGEDNESGDEGQDSRSVIDVDGDGDGDGEVQIMDHPPSQPKISAPPSSPDQSQPQSQPMRLNMDNISSRNAYMLVYTLKGRPSAPPIERSQLTADMNEEVKQSDEALQRDVELYRTKQEQLMQLMEARKEKVTEFFKQAPCHAIESYNEDQLARILCPDADAAFHQVMAANIKENHQSALDDLIKNQLTAAVFVHAAWLKGWVTGMEQKKDEDDEDDEVQEIDNKKKSNSPMGDVSAEELKAIARLEEEDKQQRRIREWAEAEQKTDELASTPSLDVDAAAMADAVDQSTKRASTTSTHAAIEHKTSDGDATMSPCPPAAAAEHAAATTAAPNPAPAPATTSTSPSTPAVIPPPLWPGDVHESIRSLLCKHGKANPNHTKLKCISMQAWQMIMEDIEQLKQIAIVNKANGSIHAAALTDQAIQSNNATTPYAVSPSPISMTPTPTILPCSELCRDCCAELELENRRTDELHALRDQLVTNLKEIRLPVSGYSSGRPDAMFISRQFKQKWLLKGQNEKFAGRFTQTDEKEDINASLLCKHKALASDEKLRYCVDRQSWLVFKALYPSSTPVPASTQPCKQCQDDSDLKEAQKEQIDEQRDAIKTALKGPSHPVLEFPSVTKGPPSSGIDYIILDHDWARAMRNFLTGTSYEIPPRLATRNLLCKHGKLRFNPVPNDGPIFPPYPSDSPYSAPGTDLGRLAYCTVPFWKKLCEDGTYVDRERLETIEFRTDINKDLSHSGIPDSRNWGSRALTTNPEPCREGCIEERIRNEKLSACTWEAATLYVRVLEPGTPLPDMGGTSGVTASGRPRRSKTSRVAQSDIRSEFETQVLSSSDPLSKLKLHIFQFSNIAPGQQQVYYQGRQLMDDSSSLAALEIPPSADIWVRIDLDGDPDISACFAESESAAARRRAAGPEDGFAGTALSSVPRRKQTQSSAASSFSSTFASPTFPSPTPSTSASASATAAPAPSANTENTSHEMEDVAPSDVDVTVCESSRRPSSGQWACKVCTLFNAPSAEQCEACQTDR